MSDRTVLVTGASRGIGRAIATRLLEEGIQVIGLARSEASHQLNHPRYTAVSVDLSQLEGISDAITPLLREHPELDGVVSVAGAGQFGDIEQFSITAIRESMELNLLSHMALARVLSPHLKQLRRGDIIFMGSEAALAGAQKGALYCAAKFGLRGFSQALRQDCSRRGVRVGIIHPGMVRTSFFDELSFRPGSAPTQAIEAADVAEAVWLMLSARPGTVIDELTLSPQQNVIEFSPAKGND